MDTTTQPRRRRGGCRRAALITAGVVIGLLVIIVVAVAASGGGKSTPDSTPSTFAPSTTAPAPQPSAVPSPGGTVKGSCDYDLGNDPVNGTAEAVGDIDAQNTGNVGIVLQITITWPQEGHSPLRMSKTVRVPYGADQDFQFSRRLTQDELSRLQDYQLGHTDSGCTYDGTVTGTFGAAH